MTPHDYFNRWWDTVKRGWPGKETGYWESLEAFLAGHTVYEEVAEVISPKTVAGNPYQVIVWTGKSFPPGTKLYVKR